MPSLFKSQAKSFKSSNGDNLNRNSAQSVTAATDISAAAAIAFVDAPELHKAELHVDAHPEGGLSCNNDQLLKDQRESITAWIASMGKKIFTGNFNLIATPFPVQMFEPRSYLEKLADAWVYPRYLRQASQLSDPVERMKLVITWFIAGLHHGFEKWKKPFNPILGETWQAALPDGSRMYMEQISHHPPITAFNLQGPGGLYRYTGLSQPHVAVVLKYYGFKTLAKGFRHLDFADGSRIEIQYPGYYIKGVVYSSRPRAEVDGVAVLTDLKHGIRAVLRFGPNKGARVPVLRRSDAVLGEIYEIAGAPSAVMPEVTVQEMPSLHDEDSGTLDDDKRHTHCGDSDFETASESDWDLRAVRDMAEQERDTDSPVLNPAHAHAVSQQRILRDSVRILSDAPFKRVPLLAHTSFTTCSRCEAASDSSVQTSIHLNSDESATSVSQSSTRPQQHPQHATSTGCDVSDADSRAYVTSTAATCLQQESDQINRCRRAAAPLVPSSSSSSNNTLFSGMSRMLGMKPSSSTSCVVQQHQTDEVGKLLARVEGSWLSHININGQRYWTLRTERSEAWQPDPNALPSDSRYRRDLVMVQQGDMGAAQVNKEELENMQRRDKKLREVGIGNVAYGH